MFNQLYIAMARTGEAAGILEDVLLRVADQLEKADSLRRQVKAAMAYPMMIGIFSLGVLLALVAFLIPVFEKVFTEFGGDLPAITQVTVAMSHFVTGRWYVLIFGDHRLDLRVQAVEEQLMGPAPVGRLQAEDSRCRSGR